jgi:CheY-like chemotaxis protein
MAETNSDCPEILLVEDNPGDVRLVLEALSESDVPSRVNVVGDGEQALDYLFRRGAYVSAARPRLVLLDLNLPRKGGLEVLAEVKKDKQLTRIPIVVLTTSRADDDVTTAYDRGVNCYVTKPGDFDLYLNLVQTVTKFWLTVVVPPPH